MHLILKANPVPAFAERKFPVPGDEGQRQEGLAAEGLPVGTVSTLIYGLMSPSIGGKGDTGSQSLPGELRMADSPSLAS